MLRFKAVTVDKQILNSFSESIKCLKYKYAVK